LNEFTRTDQRATPEVRSELYEQLSALYNMHVGDSRWDRFSDAMVDASILHCVQVLLPGTSIPGESQVAHGSSPLTDSINSNQQESNSGTILNAEHGEADLLAAMSSVAACTLFQDDIGSFSVGTSTINSNADNSISKNIQINTALTV
jgi:hypothetical protein